METTTQEETEMTFTNADGSITKVKGMVSVTDHGVVDENGYPKISTNINVPMATSRTPEEVEADRQKELFKEGV